MDASDFDRLLQRVPDDLLEEFTLAAALLASAVYP